MFSLADLVVQHFDARFDAIEQRIQRLEDRLLQQGERLLMANEELGETLNRLNELTNTMAETQTAQNEKISEVSADIDDLLTRIVDPDIKARLEQHRDTLQAAVLAGQAQAETLTQIAAKHDAPVPPPPVG